MDEIANDRFGVLLPLVQAILGVVEVGAEEIEGRWPSTDALCSKVSSVAIGPWTFEVNGVEAEATDVQLGPKLLCGPSVTNGLPCELEAGDELLARDAGCFVVHHAVAFVYSGCEVYASSPCDVDDIDLLRLGPVRELNPSVYIEDA